MMNGKNVLEKKMSAGTKCYSFIINFHNITVIKVIHCISVLSNGKLQPRPSQIKLDAQCAVAGAPQVSLSVACIQPPTILCL